jgi:hypothetical protein
MVNALNSKREWMTRSIVEIHRRSTCRFNSCLDYNKNGESSSVGRARNYSDKDSLITVNVISSEVKSYFDLLNPWS